MCFLNPCPLSILAICRYAFVVTFFFTLNVYAVFALNVYAEHVFGHASRWGKVSLAIFLQLLLCWKLDELLTFTLHFFFLFDLSDFLVCFLLSISQNHRVPLNNIRIRHRRKKGVGKRWGRGKRGGGCRTIASIYNVKKQSCFFLML